MKYITGFLLFFFATVCTAQTPDYCVYLVSGNATVESDNRKPVKLVRNQALYKEQTIILNKNAKITLVNKDADYLVLNNQGEYKVADLHKNITKQPPGVTKKYFSVLWSQMIKPASSYEDLIKNTKGGIVGGVTLGNDNCTSVLFPSNGLKTAAPLITITWNRPDEEEDYHFSLYSNAGVEIIKKTLKDTQLVIDVANQLGGNSGKYFFKVSGTRFKACDKNAIELELISSEEELKLRLAMAIEAKQNDITAQLDLIDRMNNEKRLLLASEFYKSLVKQHGKNDSLAKSYLLFLINNGFNEEAKAFSKTLKFQ